MVHVGNIGRRIELTAMDPHFHDVTFGLYEQVDSDGAPCYHVHTYSGREGADARGRRIAAAMKALGGMERAAKGGAALRFACGSAHRNACRRLFIEACKLDPEAPLEPRPLTIHDKKSEADVRAAGDGAGGYTLVPADDDAGRRRRAAAIANGLVKLAQMERDAERDDRVAFDCGHAHDALIGLLLGRAINVRAAMREAEDAASRGVLAAPSAQS